MSKLIKYCILAMGLVGSNYPMKADVMTVARSFSSHHLNHHTMQEIWKDIPNYENLYQVSNFGNVRSLKRIRIVKNTNFTKTYNGKELKKTNAVNGYLQVRLTKNRCQKTFGIHALVGSAFLGYETKGHDTVINHINKVRSDNNLYNLEIITQRENVKDSFPNAKSKYTGVSYRKNRNTWMSRILIDKKRLYLGSFKTEYDAHLAYQKALNSIKRDTQQVGN